MSDENSHRTEDERRLALTNSEKFRGNNRKKLRPSQGSLSTTSESSTTLSMPRSPHEGPHSMSGDESPYNETPHRYHGNLRASSTLRHVQLVSRRAALASKKVIWDSNDNAIDAAQSAVDQWEDVYNAIRTVLVASAQSAKSLYGAAKAGATGLEHGILLPVRDWILLPAFDAAEKTVGFLQSEQAHHAASQSLQLVQRVPWVGPTILAPSMVLSVQVFQQTWHILQYPIPSRHQVRNSVDFVLTGTKWALSTSVREVMLYMKRADAIISRTLSHTQWKVLGSGPYATLDKLNKQEVIDHLCERYFSIPSIIARYELAAHIKNQNVPLYLDLVLTGLLRERGGDLTKDDEWLSSLPSYRKNAKTAFLLPNYDFNDEVYSDGETPESFLSEEESALWFRLPYVNGKRPGRDSPWVRFNGKDRVALEQRFLAVFRQAKSTDENEKNRADEGISNYNNSIQENGLELPSTESSNNLSSTGSDYEQQQFGEFAGTNGLDISSRYPTIAQWYVPDLERDVMVDQKRYSVSFKNCCPRCRQSHATSLQKASRNYGEVCQACTEQDSGVTNHWMASSILSPPPITMVMRPNLWRFHGPGDEVRRAVWFLDTRRHGLQPYGEEAQAVLEDAYLFLKWRSEVLGEGNSKKEQEKDRQPVLESTCPENGDDSSHTLAPEDEELIGENALLTVQVESPDGGEQQLVQFSSLTAATAIKKGLGGAISLFKRRVYRGADLSPPKLPESSLGVSAEAIFSGEVSLKAQPMPQKRFDSNKVTLSGKLPQSLDDDDEWTLLPIASSEKSLAVPSLNFDEIDRKPDIEGDNDQGTGSATDDIDHLVLIVHGIGEMLQSVDLFGLAIPNLSSIIECCGFLRKNHEEVRSARFSQMYPTAESLNPSSTGRVEYLPIEWHEAFSIVSQRRLPLKNGDLTDAPVQAGARSSQVMIQDISLNTIQSMRSFANDTLLDVLYFVSSEHHDVMVDIVATEMNVVMQKFRALTGFNGRVSVIGHSLGSVILWDILSNQPPQRDVDLSLQGHREEHGSDWEDLTVDQRQEAETRLSVPSEVSEMPEVKQRSTVSFHSSEEDEERRVVSKLQYPKLTFDVDNAFMLGSPIAVFLLVRNQRKPLSETFSLNGCSRVFNIFHPFDPVSYRIEPLISPRNAAFEPKIMTHWNGGFRVQYQTKRLWRKLVHTTLQTQQHVIESLEAGILGMGLLDSIDVFEEENQSIRSTSTNDDDEQFHVVTGNLNQGRRIDFMLQEKEIEAANEYVAAFAAHSCYWQEKDLSLFIARQIYLSRLAHEQALHFEDLIPVSDNSK